MRKKKQTSDLSRDVMVRSGASPEALFRAPAGCNSEQGVALILALVMLALLGMLGAFALSTSTTEMRVSGNYRTAQSAYYAADVAAEYLKTQGDLVSIKVAPGTGNCANNTNYNAIASNLVGNQTVCYNSAIHHTLQAGRGSGSQAEMTAGSSSSEHSGPPIAAMNVIGYGPNNTELAVEVQVQWGN
jgi:Tfp pilus assembly protein PilX